MFLSTKSRRRGTHGGTKLRQQPLSAWQVSFNPSQLVLPVLSRSCQVLHPTWNNLSVLFGPDRVLNGSDQVPPSF
jgi:hypothetical protein